MVTGRGDVPHWLPESPGGESPVTHSGNGLDNTHFIICLPLSVLVLYLLFGVLYFLQLPTKLEFFFPSGSDFGELQIETVLSALDPVDPSIIYVCQRSHNFYFIFLPPAPALDLQMKGKPQNDLAMVSSKQKGKGLDKDKILCFTTL